MLYYENRNLYKWWLLFSPTTHIDKACFLVFGFFLLLCSTATPFLIIDVLTLISGFSNNSLHSWMTHREQINWNQWLTFTYAYLSKLSLQTVPKYFCQSSKIRKPSCLFLTVNVCFILYNYFSYRYNIFSSYNPFLYELCWIVCLSEAI